MREEFIGAGWAFPVRTDVTGSVALVSAEREVIESIQLILATAPGERPMRPEFGSRLRDYVFRSATVDTAAELSNEVHKALLRWEPRVDIEFVDVTVDPWERNKLFIDVNYRVKDANDKRNLVFPFYTIPQDGSDY
jgi:Bacteriophage baseplate protein W